MKIIVEMKTSLQELKQKWKKEPSHELGLIQMTQYEEQALKKKIVKTVHSVLWDVIQN